MAKTIRKVKGHKVQETGTSTQQAEREGVAIPAQASLDRGIAELERMLKERA